MNSEKRHLNPLMIVLGLSALFFVIFLIISAALFFSKTPSQNGPAAVGSSLFGQGSVGVIELNGAIMESKRTLRKLERYEEDPEIKAVVLRLNSPGGAVAPSQEIYEAVKRYKKPLVVSMGSVAASGAFYIACGAKKVFANPGTLTGSIGVIMEFANLEKLYEWAKVQRYSLKTGKFKDSGAEYRSMTAEERQLLQGMIDDVLLQFKQAVATGRKMKMEEVNQIADGRIMSGNQAKAFRLVDELGTLQDAIDAAGKLANIKGKPTLIYPDKPRKRLLDLLLEDHPGDSGSDSSSRSLISRLLGGSDEFTSLEEKITGLPAGVYWLWKGAR